MLACVARDAVRETAGSAVPVRALQLQLVVALDRLLHDLRHLVPEDARWHLHDDATDLLDQILELLVIVGCRALLVVLLVHTRHRDDVGGRVEVVGHRLAEFVLVQLIGQREEREPHADRLDGGSMRAFR